MKKVSKLSKKEFVFCAINLKQNSEGEDEENWKKIQCRISFISQEDFFLIPVKASSFKMTSDQSFAILYFSKLGDFPLISVVLSVAFSAQQLTNRVRQNFDIFRIALNNQGASLGIDGISNRNEEEM